MDLYIKIKKLQIGKANSIRENHFKEILQIYKKRYWCLKNLKTSY